MTQLTRPLLTGTLLLSLLFALQPALATECANSGEAPLTPPDDTDDRTATACGDSASAAGANSTALGERSSASGNYSVALGSQADAGNQATALGERSEAAGSASAALGSLAFADGVGATALGFQASANGTANVSLGYLATSTGSSATAIGARASATQNDSIVLGAIPGINGAGIYADVAIGTTTPDAPLHVTRNDGTASILVEETNAAPAPRTLFTLANPGNTKFEILESDSMNSWAFTNSGNDFRVSLQDSGAVEFRVDNLGNSFVHNNLHVDGVIFGTLAMVSDAAMKQNVASIDTSDVLERVARLPISSWEYRDAPGQRHLGPMAQDFRAAFGLGDGDRHISVVDSTGVALASIQALNHKLEARNGALEAQVTTLREELQILKSVVERLAGDTGR